MRIFKQDFVAQAIHEDSAMLRASGTTGQTWEDGLVEGRWAVFEFEGKLYRVQYRDGSDYWYENCGEPVEPFGHIWREKVVECEEVKAVPVTTYRYEPIE